MLRTYEAVYSKGRVDWLASPPPLPDGTRVLVVVEEEDRPAATGDADRQTLDAAWGAWGAPRSPDAIDRELNALREEWDDARKASLP